MTRDEHLTWAKQRALAYVDRGDLRNAFASMTSDLNKHPDLAAHSGTTLGLMLMMGGLLDTPARMRDHIEGYR